MQEQQAQGWFVSDGSSVSGPISNDDLARGAATRRWGETCLVWMHPWAEWRSIEAIREIKALRRAQQARGASWIPQQGWSAEDGARYRMNRTCASIASARDDDEVVSLALRALMYETRATVGLVHRTRTTVAEIEAWRAADREPMAIDSAMEGADADALRAVCPGNYVVAVGRKMQGVALVPIYASSGLFAVLELAKHDRPFRGSDGRWFETIGDRASARLM